MAFATTMKIKKCRQFVRGRTERCVAPKRPSCEHSECPDQKPAPEKRNVPAGGVHESVEGEVEYFWMDYGGSD